MGYKFQFVTLAGFHALNHSMFELARGYKDRGMAAYSELQEAEFGSEVHGYSATRHQREVGTGYFDEVSMVDINEIETGLMRVAQNQFPTDEYLSGRFRRLYGIPETPQEESGARLR